MIEICCGSYYDALQAARGGARRIELNCGLHLGGLTPSLASLELTKEHCDLSVIAMVRPRGGGFCYSGEDFQVMERECAQLVSHGADGIAFGCLNRDATLCREQNARLIDLCLLYTSYRLGTGAEENGEAGSVFFEAALSYPRGITIREILERISAKAAAWGLKVCLIQNYDPVAFDKDSPMVQALQECYELVTGLDGTPVTTTGGTYAKAMPGIVPFGPSFPGQKGIGHNPN